jgi:alkylmercury lyase
VDEMKRFLELIGSHMTTEEKAISEAAFHAILRGEPIDQTGLVAATGLVSDTVEALLEGLCNRGLTVVEPESGRVVGSWGLSLVPTTHRLRVRGREMFTWCAVDAVGIPAGLGERARITSRCHQCDSVVSVEMTAGHVTRAEPAGVQLWLTASQAGRSVVGFT